MNPIRKWAAGLAIGVLGFAIVGALADPSEPRVQLSTSSDSRSLASLPSTADVPSTAAAAVPTPSTTIVVRKVTVKQRIPFTKQTVLDATLDQGSTKIVRQGRSGYRARTYSYTYRDGRVVKRTLISVRVIQKPVTQVTHIGTKIKSKPVGSGDCDPNYSDCVPIASDVDCAGGSGNGPEYVAGPVRVIGDDIYDLDRDGDGAACE